MKESQFQAFKLQPLEMWLMMINLKVLAKIENKPFKADSGLWD